MLARAMLFMLFHAAVFSAMFQHAFLSSEPLLAGC
jgi:hypothetical protein